MRIDASSGSENLYGIYNRIPSAVSFLSGKNPSEQKSADNKEDNLQNEQAVASTQRVNSTIGDLSVTFGNKDESLVGLGNIGGIQSNVMRQAVNNMQKDSVLHEYQYFVGSGAIRNTADQVNGNSKVIVDDEDGVIIRKS